MTIQRCKERTQAVCLNYIKIVIFSWPSLCLLIFSCILLIAKELICFKNQCTPFWAHINGWCQCWVGMIGLGFTNDVQLLNQSYVSVYHWYSLTSLINSFCNIDRMFSIPFAINGMFLEKVVKVMICCLWCEKVWKNRGQSRGVIGIVFFSFFSSLLLPLCFCCGYSRPVPFWTSLWKATITI